MSPLASLARYSRPTVRHPPRGDRCELCAAPIGDRHPHVVELRDRAMRCACTACAVLFRDPGAGGGRYRTVPDRVRFDPAFAPSASDWAALNVPVRLAFFVRGQNDAWTAFYPSPAGPVEAPLDPGAATRLQSLAPLARDLETDIESLLVRRDPAGSSACFLVPIDLSYELVGLVRSSWRGFAGGDQASRQIDGFFERLRARAQGGRP